MAKVHRDRAATYEAIDEVALPIEADPIPTGDASVEAVYTPELVDAPPRRRRDRGSRRPIAPS